MTIRGVGCSLPGVGGSCSAGHEKGFAGISGAQSGRHKWTKGDVQTCKGRERTEGEGWDDKTVQRQMSVWNVSLRAQMRGAGPGA